MKKDNTKKDNRGNQVTRREALKKGGVIALTAATMMVLMPTPAKAKQSIPDKMPNHGRPAGRKPYPDDGK
jgi:hypothetical protein